MDIVSIISALGLGSILSGIAAAVVSKRKDKLDAQTATLGLSDTALKVARNTLADLEKSQETVRQLRRDLEKMEAIIERYRSVLDKLGIDPDAALADT